MSAKQLNWTKENKSINIELMDDEYDYLMAALPEGVSLSEILRQAVDKYSKKKRAPRDVSFWVPNAQYEALQAKADDAGMYFKAYMRQLLTDFFRDGGKV